jgi:hypothetical protein
LNVCFGAAIYGAVLLVTRYYRPHQLVDLLRRR